MFPLGPLNYKPILRSSPFSLLLNTLTLRSIPILLSLPDLRSGKWIVKWLLRLSIFRRRSLSAKDVFIKSPSVKSSLKKAQFRIPNENGHG